MSYFRNSQLDKINVYGNGETVYVLKDESDKITGINTVSCSQMRIDVKDKEIQRISFSKKPDAILYPYDELPKKWRKLDGFLWRFEEKPTKKEIFFKLGIFYANYLRQLFATLFQTLIYL